MRCISVLSWRIQVINRYKSANPIQPVPILIFSRSFPTQHIIQANIPYTTLLLPIPLLSHFHFSVAWRPSRLRWSSGRLWKTDCKLGYKNQPCCEFCHNHGTICTRWKHLLSECITWGCFHAFPLLYLLNHAQACRKPIQIWVLEMVFPVIFSGV